MFTNPEKYQLAKQRTYSNNGCAAIMRKIQEEPDACNFFGNPDDIQKHIDIAVEISKRFGIIEDQVYMFFSKSARKPLDRYESDTDLWNKMVNRIGESVKDRIPVTESLVKDWLRQEGIPLTVSKGKRKPSALENLKSVLPKENMLILEEIKKKYELTDDLGALSMVLSWAKEQMIDA